MSPCDYKNVDDLIVTVHKENPLMKKLMSVMLGLSLVLGTASLFAQDKTDAPKKEKKAKKTKAKKTTEEKK